MSNQQNTTHLNLNDIKFSYSDLPHFADALKKNTILEVLCMTAHCRISPAGQNIFVETVCGMKTLNLNPIVDSSHKCKIENEYLQHQLHHIAITQINYVETNRTRKEDFQCKLIHAIEHITKSPCNLQYFDNFPLTIILFALELIQKNVCLLEWHMLLDQNLMDTILLCVIELNVMTLIKGH